MNWSLHFCSKKNRTCYVLAKKTLCTPENNMLHVSCWAAQHKPTKENKIVNLKISLSLLVVSYGKLLHGRHYCRGWGILPQSHCWIALAKSYCISTMILQIIIGKKNVREVRWKWWLPVFPIAKYISFGSKKEAVEGKTGLQNIWHCNCPVNKQKIPYLRKCPGTEARSVLCLTLSGQMEIEQEIWKTLRHKKKMNYISTKSKML